MPAEAVDVLDAVDVAHLVEVQEVCAFFFQDERVVDCFGRDVRVVQELACAEEEGEELVVVEAPDAVAARGLEVVCALDAAHEAEVRREDLQCESRERRLWEEREPVEAEEPEEEV